MCSKCDLLSHYGCIDALNPEGKQNINLSGSPTESRGGSELPVVSTMSESSAPIMVYSRKKLQRRSASVPSGHYSASLPVDDINFVYHRRKLPRNSGANISAHILAKPSQDILSNSASILLSRSGNPSSVAMEKHTTSRTLDNAEALRSPSMSVIICNTDPLGTNSETGGGWLVVEDHASDGPAKLHKSLESCSVDDSCSSSVLNMDMGSALEKTEVDDTGECSSTGVLVLEAMGDGLSEKELCINILRSHGLLSAFRKSSQYKVGDDLPASCGTSTYRACNVCGNMEPISNMLICDDCEAAFHILCCNPVMREIPEDEWQCQSCFNKKHKIMRETAVKSPIMRSETSSRLGRPTTDDGPISLMLKETEPYTTGVRIGKNFQANVPEWTGPISEDIDFIEQPKEMDLSNLARPYEFIPRKPTWSNSICNWLQCRQVVLGLEEGVDGTVCGKWRRAPLFEVQTEDWDCFRCILWDPRHADCAVPQELDTNEVLKQLKYVEMVRPRLAAKRQKQDIAEVDRS